MGKICERYGNKKLFITCIVITCFISLIFSLSIYYISNRFEWENISFKLIAKNDAHYIFEDEDDAILDVTLKSGSWDSSLILLEIKYLNKTIIYDNLDFLKDLTITLSDGSIYTEETHLGRVQVVDASKSASSPSEVILIHRIFEVIHNRVSVGMFIFIFFSLSFLLCWGLRRLFILISSRQSKIC